MVRVEMLSRFRSWAIVGVWLLSCFGPLAFAANHALILTIGQYADPQANLPGIDLDGAKAQQIASQMGVPPQNVVQLANTRLTVAGIKGALNDIAAKVMPGDGVFIYYSGHGGQTSGAGGRKCMEGLVAHDMALFRDQDIEEFLNALGARAGRVVMMNDSCFSGGAATRGIGLAPAGAAGLAPKAWKSGPSAQAADYTCGEGVNQRPMRSLFEKPRPANVLYVAAAADNEVAFATPDGSSATKAWLGCMTAASDSDNSGSLSGEEIRACAQAKLEEANVRQTITVVGNEKMPLSLLIAPLSAPAVETRPPVATGSTAGAGRPSLPTSQTPVPSLPAPAASSAPTPAPAAVVQPPTTQTALASPAMALADIRNAASNANRVQLTPTKSELVIGKDAVAFRVSSEKPGYLYVLHVGSDGKTFDLLFPNARDKENKITAGTVELPRPAARDKANKITTGTIELPRPTWRVLAGGPVGTSYLLAIVSDQPRNFAQELSQPMGPFSQAPATRLASRNLVIEAVGGSQVSPGRFSASEVVPIREVNQ